MMFEPIDIEWSHRNFPNVFEVFGKELDSQIIVFNRVIGHRPRSEDDRPIVFNAMYDEGIRKPLPHRPILNSLSALQDFKTAKPTATGWLVRLEMLIAETRTAELPQTMFRDMLRSSGSYYDLISELEWGSSLRRLNNNFIPHTRTRPDVAGNFDINWGIDGYRVLGDVKFFKNWLL